MHQPWNQQVLRTPLLCPIPQRRLPSRLSNPEGALEVVQALLEAGADVDARDSAGGVALHAAVLRRHVDVARVLLEAGSACNAVDQGNNTPLHMLASAPTEDNGGNGGVEGEAGAALVALLLEWGASVDIKNSQGLTPMSAALDNKNRATVLAYRTFFGDDAGLAVFGDANNTAGGRDLSKGFAVSMTTGPAGTSNDLAERKTESA